MSKGTSRQERSYQAFGTGLVKLASDVVSQKNDV